MSKGIEFIVDDILESKLKDDSFDYIFDRGCFHVLEPESLKQFSENINNQLKGLQVSEDKVKSINESIDALAKEVEDIKLGTEQEIDYVKEANVNAKTASVIQKVLDVLPHAAETAATFTPLAPFSKIIGKGVQEIVDTIKNKKRRRDDA
jgi:molecular chaperone GrpE (heat shock protein)